MTARRPAPRPNPALLARRRSIEQQPRSPGPGRGGLWVLHQTRPLPYRPGPYFISRETPAAGPGCGGILHGQTRPPRPNGQPSSCWSIGRRLRAGGAAPPDRVLRRPGDNTLRLGPAPGPFFAGTDSNPGTRLLMTACGKTASRRSHAIPARMETSARPPRNAIVPYFTTARGTCESLHAPGQPEKPQMSYRNRWLTWLPVVPSRADGHRARGRPARRDRRPRQTAPGPDVTCWSAAPPRMAAATVRRIWLTARPASGPVHYGPPFVRRLRRLSRPS